MSYTELMKPIASPPARLSTTLVVTYYVTTFVAGLFIVSFRGRLAFAVDFLVAALYLGFTILLYGLSRPVSGRPSSPPENRGPVSHSP